VWCESIRNSHYKTFLKVQQKRDFEFTCARLWWDSQIDPAKIANPQHSRAMPSRPLFRARVDGKFAGPWRFALKFSSNGPLTPAVAARLKQSSDDVEKAIQDLGDGAAKGRTMGAQTQKLAALAALFALR